MKRRITGNLVVAAAIMVGMVAVSSASADDNKLQLEGSTTVGPIAKGFAKVMMQGNADLDISVSMTGSGDGAAAMIDGKCDVACMSRMMKAKEFKKAVENEVNPVIHTVAMDGVSVVIHPSNPVDKLSSEQVKKIYTGEVSNWKQLGGPDMEIVVISRDTSSGTYGVFSDKIMGEDKMGKNVSYVKSNSEARDKVKTTKGAIGYIGFGYLGDETKAIALDGVKPTAKSIAQGDFPLARPLFMVTNGFPKVGSLAYKFVTFHLTETGQEVVSDQGFVPMTQY